MALWLLVSVFGILLFIGTFGVAYLVMSNSQDLADRVTKSESHASGRPFPWQTYRKRIERIFKQLGEVMPRSTEDMSKLELRLVQAGIRRKDGPVLFYGIEVVVGLALLAVAALSGYLQSYPFLCLTLCILFGAMIPDLGLRQRVSRRKERIRMAIPDALDLAVICVEAGLGLDQSLMRIGREIRRNHPDFSDELRLFNLEVNAGESRVRSLRNLARRADVDDLKALVAVLIQTDRFGTSVAQSLRVFSDSLRVKRRQRAEERANKMNVEMVLPLIVFILPATVVVVVGPALISVAEGLVPLLMKH